MRRWLVGSFCPNGCNYLNTVKKWVYNEDYVEPHREHLAPAAFGIHFTFALTHVPQARMPRTLRVEVDLVPASEFGIFGFSWTDLDWPSRAWLKEIDKERKDRCRDRPRRTKRSGNGTFPVADLSTFIRLNLDGMRWLDRSGCRWICMLRNTVGSGTWYTIAPSLLDDRGH